MGLRSVSSLSPTPFHPTQEDLSATHVLTSSIPPSHLHPDSGIGASPNRTPEIAPDTPIIRSGAVKFKGYGFVTSWLWSRKSLALTKEILSVHKRENSRASTIINLKDLTKVERTEIKPYCLLLETKDKRFRVSFKNDDELYGWQDDIYHHSPLVSFGNPTNFVHQVHVGFDTVTGAFTGIPETWEGSLTKSALAEKGSAEGWQAALDKVEPYADREKRETEVLGLHPSYRPGTSGPRSNLAPLPPPHNPPMYSVGMSSADAGLGEAGKHPLDPQPQIRGQGHIQGVKKSGPGKRGDIHLTSLRKPALPRASELAQRVNTNCATIPEALSDEDGTEPTLCPTADDDRSLLT